MDMSFHKEHCLFAVWVIRHKLRCISGYPPLFLKSVAITPSLFQACDDCWQYSTLSLRVFTMQLYVQCMCFIQSAITYNIFAVHYPNFPCLIFFKDCCLLCVSFIAPTHSEMSTTSWKTITTKCLSNLSFGEKSRAFLMIWVWLPHWFHHWSFAMMFPFDSDLRALIPNLGQNWSCN